MATHSSILAWKILWTKEPGGLQSMGLQSRTRLSMHTQLTSEVAKQSSYNFHQSNVNKGLSGGSGEGNSTPFQYSCLENPMDGGAW